MRRAFTVVLVSASLLRLGACGDDDDDRGDDVVATTSVPSDLPGAGRLVLPPRINAAVLDDPLPAVEAAIGSIRGLELDHPDLVDQDLITLMVKTCEFFDLSSAPPAEANAAVMRLLAGRLLYEGLTFTDEDPEILKVLTAYLGAATPSLSVEALTEAVNALAAGAVDVSCDEHGDKLDFRATSEGGG